MTSSTAPPAPAHGPEPTLVLATCMRNGSRHLGRVEALLRRAGTAFRTHVVVVESDSTDDTPALLKAWADRDARVQAISLGRLAARLPLRTQRIAHCRNAYLDAARAHFDRHGEGLLVVFDSDDLLSRHFIDRFDVELRQALARMAPYDWAAFSAVTAPYYYDIWALRHEGWASGDCWDGVQQLGRQGFGPAAARYIAVHSRMLPIRLLERPLPVLSAFNGMGVYRSQFLGAARYVGLTDQGEETCEHVPFHAAVRQAGGGHRLYIDPAFVVGRTPAEHYPTPGAGEVLWAARMVLRDLKARAQGRFRRAVPSFLSRTRGRTAP